jgi:hypothetical protein
MDESTLSAHAFVRVATVDLTEPPEWQRKVAWQLAPVGDAITAALTERLHPSGVDDVKADLAARDLELNCELERVWPGQGSVTITVLQADDTLARRFFALRGLPERDVILDDLLDEETAARGIERITVGDHAQLELAVA